MPTQTLVVAKWLAESSKTQSSINDIEHLVAWILVYDRGGLFDNTQSLVPQDLVRLLPGIPDPNLAANQNQAPEHRHVI